MIGRIECDIGGVPTIAELNDDFTWSSKDDDFAEVLNATFSAADYCSPSLGFDPQLGAAAAFFKGKVLERRPIPKKVDGRVY